MTFDFLVSTDFDGTLTDPFAPSTLAPAFFDWLEKARARASVAWVINTGRDWESLLVELETRKVPIWPDWVILIEREIHHVDRRQLYPLNPWNDRCHRASRLLFEKARPCFEAMRQALARFEDLAMVQDIGSPLGFIAASEDQADEVERIILPLMGKLPDMTMVRNSIYFRFSHRDYNKGTALSELALRLGLTSSLIFTAGDHYNDLPMLDPAHAGWLACPQNAIPEVKHLVVKHGGYVAAEFSGAGVAEALEHFFPHGKLRKRRAR